MNLAAFYRLSLLLTGDEQRAEALLFETLGDCEERLGEIRESHREAWLASRLKAGAVKFSGDFSEGGRVSVGGREMELVCRAFQALSERQRSALGLFYTDLFDGDEIAKIMGLTLEQLCEVLMGARQVLNSALSEEGEARGERDAEGGGNSSA
jgi:hypothetical protein